MSIATRDIVKSVAEKGREIINAGDANPYCGPMVIIDPEWTKPAPPYPSPARRNDR